MFFDVSYETHNANCCSNNKKLFVEKIKLNAEPIPNCPNDFYPLLYYAIEEFLGGIVE